MDGVHGSGAIEHRTLDLASFASVRAFARGLIEDGVEVDAIILNAATMKAGSVSEDGIELMYQVNHLSHFLLAHLVKPILRPRARVVWTSSSMHFSGAVNRAAYSASAKNRGADTAVRGIPLYSDTKLFNAMAAAQMDADAQRAANGADGAPPLADALCASSHHPGFVHSQLDAEAPPPMKYVVPSGALTTARIATDFALGRCGAPGSAACGRYLSDDCINDLCLGLVAHRATRDAEALRWLYNTSVALVGGLSLDADFSE